MKRRVFHVVPHHKGWRITLNGKPVCVIRLKADAIKEAVRLAWRDWRKGLLAQVKIHRRDGVFQREFTYGKDPERHKG